MLAGEVEQISRTLIGYTPALSACSHGACLPPAINEHVVPLRPEAQIRLSLCDTMETSWLIVRAIAATKWQSVADPEMEDPHILFEVFPGGLD